MVKYKHNHVEHSLAARIDVSASDKRPVQLYVSRSLFDRFRKSVCKNFSASRAFEEMMRVELEKVEGQKEVKK